MPTEPDEPSRRAGGPPDPDELLAAVRGSRPPVTRGTGDREADEVGRACSYTAVPPCAAAGEPGTGDRESHRMTFTPDGPVLVEGPVDLVTADGTEIHADRFLVAICLCKRSRTYPLCDTSHRRRRRTT